MNNNETRSVYFFAFGIWLLFVVCAIINGTFRNIFLTPNIGELTAHIVSTITLSLIILIVSYGYISKKGKWYSNRQLQKIGVFWLLLTILFEFVFQHYIMGVSWERLLVEYNIFAGRIWILILIITLLAPLVCGIIIKRKSN